MDGPTVNDLTTFTGEPIAREEQGKAVLSIVTALASSYTRGMGFDADGAPADDLRAVILSASARLLTNISGVQAESLGPFSVRYGDGFGWTVAEQCVLNRYRVRAQ